MVQCTLAFGYYAAACMIESSVPNVWLPSDMLSVAYFVSKPPTAYPTRAKHLIRIAPTATPAEREFFALLSQALSLRGRRSGVLDFRQSHQCLGILSASSVQPELLVLQIVQLPDDPPVAPEPYPPLVPDRLPAELVSAAEQYRRTGQGEQRVRAIAQETHRIASVYGYWDLWHILEGICKRFELDPRQLIAPQ